MEQPRSDLPGKATIYTGAASDEKIDILLERLEEETDAYRDTHYTVEDSMPEDGPLRVEDEEPILGIYVPTLKEETHQIGTDTIVSVLSGMDDEQLESMKEHG